MTFMTMRNNEWKGGDVTMSDDGRFIVVELRDPNPVRGYVIVDLRTGQAVKGQYKTLRQAQEAAMTMKWETSPSTNQPSKKEGA
jgi:hypothetical protein